MNGSGLLLLNAPWRIDTALASALKVLREVLDEGGGSMRLEWLRAAS
jgi:23S rRNA (adenine2030-N6)-methyltransferase